MPSNFPGSLDVMPNPTSSTFLDDAGFELDVLISNNGDAIQQLEAKMGVGASNQSPVASRVLGADGTGSSSWRQIATADLVSNAVSQLGFAVGSTSGPTTTSTTFVDITEMAVTLTTTGGTLVAFLSVRLSHGTSGTLSGIALGLDSGQVSQTERTHTVTTNNGQFLLATHHLWTGVSAGSHTIKGRWYTAAGTLTAQSDCRSLVVMELKR